MKKCILCKKKLIGKRRRFCSKFCGSSFWNKNNEGKCKKSKIMFLMKHIGYNSEKQREFRKKHPEFQSQKHKYEKERYPERLNSWKNDYKKRKDFCELCGSKERLEFHHISYKAREGITVCFPCHRYKIHGRCIKHGKKIR